MGVISIPKGEEFHYGLDDRVQTLEILAKGTVQMDNGIYTVVAKVGALLGLAETPGELYRFTYKALEDVQVFSYPYESLTDIPKVICANQKISPVLTSECVRLAVEALNVGAQKFTHVQEAYDRVLTEYAEYPDICAAVGEFPQSFEEMKTLQPPVKSDHVQEWEVSYLHALFQNAETMRKSCYAVSPDIAAGIVMSTAKYYQAVTQECELSRAYEEKLRADTTPFRSAMQLARSKKMEKERGSADTFDAAEAPPIVDAMDTILTFAQAEQSVTDEFREAMLQFRENKNRYDSSDDARMFRRNLGKLFYEIYYAAFLRAREVPESVPSEVRMLFMFGFIDEVIAGEDNTKMLYSILRSYKPDPEGKIVTAYEWLNMVYDGQVEPSKNEFDQDYPTYLREQKTTGSISEEQMQQLLVDEKNRFLFEARNMFSIGGRVTFGHVATFVPFFDELNLLRPMIKAYVNVETVTEVLDRIRSIDYGIFSRQRSFSKPEIGLNQLFLDEVIMPYMILMPIVGCRGSHWQEIEGKNRGTPARMLLPIFHTEDLDDCILRLCGDFRWEMCKTEQGIHWNDVTDPSLTALYCDYLQFYKKNHSLSEDNKEKLKTALKKYNNNYKSVFISDYITYINFEANESPRLNKIVRDILFTFCPFPKEMRDRMTENPQYRDLIKKHNTQTNNKIRPLAGLIKRLQNDGIEVPEELMAQYEYLRM